MTKQKYTFSGHESFYCKSLWLKKGFDFVNEGKDFNADDAVVALGVGKNMVAAIRFWMRAFGLLKDDHLTELAKSLLDSDNGYDPYLEDIGTIWLLHYMLVTNDFASIYNLFFLYFKKERGGDFSKNQLQLFLKRKCDETGNPQLYNENTVRRDIGVLLQNYISPIQSKNNEDFAALLISLNLIKMSDQKSDQQTADNKKYYINENTKSSIAGEIFLYAILDQAGKEKSIDFDFLMNIASIFCMSKTELIEMLIKLTKDHSDSILYSDNSGIRQLLILNDIHKEDILRQYYTR